MSIVCFTLCDITRTGFTKKPRMMEEYQLRNQQRNFETFLQVIGMRAQPTDISMPLMQPAEYIERYNFGEYFMGPVGFTYNIWTFSFESENISAYGNEHSPVGTLVEDFENVPIITNLTENAKLNQKICTKGKYCNTYFI
jgi:hypothetical protein